MYSKSIIYSSTSSFNMLKFSKFTIMQTHIKVKTFSRGVIVLIPRFKLFLGSLFTMRLYFRFYIVIWRRRLVKKGHSKQVNALFNGRNAWCHSVSNVEAISSAELDNSFNLFIENEAQSIMFPDKKILC